MELNDISMKILNKRYLLRDENNDIIETPEEMLERVANYVCSDDENLKNQVLNLMMNLKFLPNTPTLMNAGMNNMLSACFVVPVFDSLESIVHEACWQQAVIHKMGGGVGLNLSNLRPKGSLIKTTGGVTGGVLSFLKLFDRMSDVIHQGGKRNGANIGILNIDHPEIENFIKCKTGNKLDYNNFNLSVIITDEFMNAVKNNLKWELKFNGEVRKIINAKNLFALICDCAWSCGCPGILFEDTINEYNMFDKLPENERMHMNVTNPCLVGDTILETIYGPKTFKELVDKGISSTRVMSYNFYKKNSYFSDFSRYVEMTDIRFVEMTDIRLTEKNAEIIRIYIDYSDNYFEGTLNHNIYLSNKKKVMLKDLKIGDHLHNGYNTSCVVTKVKCLKERKDVYNGFVDDCNKYFIKVGNEYILSANCGEQPLYCGEYKGEIIAESCNLGSINLSRFVDKDGNILWVDLYNTVDVAVKFLDKVIDVNKYPFDFIDKGTKLTRKIGLGVTGFSDMLIKMGISYNSEKAIDIANNIMYNIKDQSYITSRNLGKKYGLYPLAELINDNKRNAEITTIAPTGTIGRLMIGHGYALGIEPPFSLSMTSNIIETSFNEGVHPLLIEKLNEFKLNPLIEEISKNGSSIQHIKEIPEDVRKLFLTAHEIPVEQHLKIQAAFQEYTDNAVSKTVNLSYDTTVEDVSKAFLMAYELKCKGVTVFRDMCKDEQVMISSKNNDKNDNNIINEIEIIEDLIPRSEILDAINITKKTGCNTLFITLTKPCDNDGILECFINTSGKGGCRSMQDGLAITISVYQRYLEGIIGHEHANNALKIVADHLMNVTCQSSMMAINKQNYEEKNGNVIKHKINSRSCPNAVAQSIKYMLDNKISVKNDVTNDVINNIKLCKECGVELIRQEGCNSLNCPICNYGGCN